MSGKLTQMSVRRRAQPELGGRSDNDGERDVRGAAARHDAGAARRPQVPPK